MGKGRVSAIGGLGALVALLPLAFALPAQAAGHGGQPSVLSAADIVRLAADANQRSIIVFKDQHPDAPPRAGSLAVRAQKVGSDQAPVVGELRQLHAPNLKTFSVVNAVSATISKAEASRLAANPAVREVVPDVEHPAMAGVNASAPPALAPAGSAQPDAELQQVCPTDPAVPLLEPEALQALNVEFQPGTKQPAAHDLFDGSGVKVGIIADGLDPNNPDLERNGKSIVFDYQDFSGFGNAAPTDSREAFLDSGSIAAQGSQVYDLSKFVNPAHPLPPGCNIRIKGIAPGATLAVMNVGGSAPGFFNSQIIQGIDRAVTVDRVDVLNESFGGSAFPQDNTDPVSIADENAVAAGVTVVASSGDAGVTNTIGTPASDAGIISVGATTTYRVYRQTGRYGSQLSAGGWEDDNISALSSGGFNQFGPRTVDVVAPGDRGWTLCSTDVAHYTGCRSIDNGTPQPIWAAGGTSASAPETSGTAALVIQAYAKTHNGARPSPALVKQIIVSTATDLGAQPDHQGAGLVNARKAVQLAMSIQDGNGSPARQGSGLLVSRTSLTGITNAGASRSFHVDVTNDGAAAQTVTPSVAGLQAPVAADTGTVDLTAGSPTFVDGEGRTARFQLHQLAVPAGADTLSGDLSWDARPTAAAPSKAVFETLFDPAGRISAYSLIDGDATGFGHVEVRKPMAGTWTAAIFTINQSAPFTGSVRFSYFTQKFAPAGSVAPASRTLKPGQSGGFTVTVPASAQAGDESASLRLGTGGGSDGSVPIVLRSLVPLNASGGHFAGALTGGAGTVGEQLAYQFDVPKGRPSLNVGVKLQDPNYNLAGFLVDPKGEPQDIQATATPGGFSNTVQFFRNAPAAGRWTVVLWLQPPLDGSRFLEPFTAAVDFARAPVSASGLPNSGSVVLAQGKPVTATVTVANDGLSGKDYFVDPRLNRRAMQALLGAGTTAVPLPLSLAAQPNWLVPTGTDNLIVAAHGTVPLVMDISAAFGSPDRLGVGLPGNFNVAQAGDPELAPGIWFALPEAQGPSPDAGVGNATVDLGAVADTFLFDSAVTSTSGDVWAQSVDTSAGYSPVTLAPGQSGKITLTITPNAPKGSVVHGFVAVDTFNGATLSGDEVALIPYTYRVG